MAIAPMLFGGVIYNPSDWYWDVRDHQASGIFSTKRLLYVPLDDAEYVAWLESGRKPHQTPNEAEFWPSLQSRLPEPPPAWWFDGTTFSRPDANSYTTTQLHAYAADVRWRKEMSGVVVNDMMVATDIASQAKVDGAYSFVKDNPNTVVRWKLPTGFVSLTSDQVIVMARAVGNFIEACFSTEAELYNQISSGEVTSLEQIDAAFAAIT